MWKHKTEPFGLSLMEIVTRECVQLQKWEKLSLKFKQLQYKIAQQSGELIICLDLQMANSHVIGAQKSCRNSSQRCGPFVANDL